MKLERLIEPIEQIEFKVTDEGYRIIDVDSVCEILEKLNEVIAYINNKEREEKQK
jgi:hypothetical protein